ncbi:DASH complex subunit ask1 [Cyphellophora attinorum]|uniref:DASH complex subunit ASK1 n=1 Tax=Cyphellophora attinorum TaxID=1664694 RepID=A0A0N1HF04_9EURO|nr:DASH complex subunit ask1 [Phialophora attinorum]KPI43604.1 DASH complex subunit ask1 [Phialophora attinorum]
MARASSASQQRQLTATEELEKLEQSITLTLQEIDHNFSRAHRIVTSSILPIVEEYASHSRDVWEGSKFWKQFFEASANVSLSGYEDQSIQQSHLPDETTTETEDSHATNSHTTLETSESYSTPAAQHISTDSIQDLDISNMTLSPSKSSTPRPTHRQARDDTSTSASYAEYPSPYEALRQEVNQTAVDTTSMTKATDYDDTQQPAPSTPGAQTRLEPTEYETRPQSSPFLPSQQPPPSSARPTTARKKTDPLLHRILDKNYRVQATPLTTRKHNAATPGTSQRTQRRLFDSSPMSSPEVPAPQLNSALFSPRKPTNPRSNAPRVPGVSVLTPRRDPQAAAAQQSRIPQPSNAQYTPQHPASQRGTWDINSSDDEDDSDVLQFGSPPKTMQFHVPQNRLLKTPAKEATRQIVDSILSTAGLNRPHREHDGQDGAQATGGIDFTDDDIDFELDVDGDDGRYDYDELQADLPVTPGAAGARPTHRGQDFDDGGGGDMTDRSPTVVRPARVEDETF